MPTGLEAEVMSQTRGSEEGGKAGGTASVEAVGVVDVIVQAFAASWLARWKQYHREWRLGIFRLEERKVC